MLTISEITTRELVAAIRSERYTDWYEDPSRRSDQEFEFSRVRPGKSIETLWVTRTELRNELATREHIPTKKDAKTLRRLQAQTGLSKDEIYARHGAEFYPKNRIAVTKERYIHIVEIYGKTMAAKRYVIK